MNFRRTAELPTGPVQGLPAWYFPIAGTMAGLFDLAQGLTLYVIPVLIVANLVLAKTVLRARMRYVKALWRNKRTRLLALGLVGVRMLMRFGLVLAASSLSAAAGHVVLGVLMAVVGTASMWFDQWIILRTLNRNRATAESGQAAAPVVQAAA